MSSTSGYKCCTCCPETGISEDTDKLMKQADAIIQQARDSRQCCRPIGKPKRRSNDEETFNPCRPNPCQQRFSPTGRVTRCPEQEQALNFYDKMAIRASVPSEPTQRYEMKCPRDTDKRFRCECKNPPPLPQPQSTPCNRKQTLNLCAGLDSSKCNKRIPPSCQNPFERRQSKCSPVQMPSSCSQPCTPCPCSPPPMRCAEMPPEPQRARRCNPCPSPCPKPRPCPTPTPCPCTCPCPKPCINPCPKPCPKPCPPDTCPCLCPCPCQCPSLCSQPIQIGSECIQVCLCKPQPPGRCRQPPSRVLDPMKALCKAKKEFQEAMSALRRSKSCSNQDRCIPCGCVGLCVSKPSPDPGGPCHASGKRFASFGSSMNKTYLLEENDGSVTVIRSRSDIMPKETCC